MIFDFSYPRKRRKFGIFSTNFFRMKYPNFERQVMKLRHHISPLIYDKFMMSGERKYHMEKSLEWRGHLIDSRMRHMLRTLHFNILIAELN